MLQLFASVSTLRAEILIAGVFLSILLTRLKDVAADDDFVSYDYGFILADKTNPEHISEFPSNRSNDVPLDSEISVTFSEQVLPGLGRIVLSSPGDVRSIPARDPQISRVWETNVTLVLTPSEPLQNDVEYYVEVSAGFAVDLAGNQFQGVSFVFRTEGGETNFAAFAPYVQAPSSPVIFAFRTDEACLYGSQDDSYSLVIWPSDSKMFHVGVSGSGGMNHRCARITEISPGFPSVEECLVRESRFEIVLRTMLRALTEYSFVVQWPTTQSSTGSSEVDWNLVVRRQYEGISVDVQHFKPWRHRFRDYLVNDVDESRSKIVEFNIAPLAESSLNTWLGPSTVREFRIELKFGEPGLLPGSHIILVAEPLLGWSTNPATPSNASVLHTLDNVDLLHLSDPKRRAAPCLHFFPQDFPYTTQCRLLELGLGTYSYGVELRLPRHGFGAKRIKPDTLNAFALALPGVRQPLALISHWEAILVQAPARAGDNATHSVRLASSQAVLLETTEGMSLRVVSSDFPYTAPVGTQINRVDIDFTIGVFVSGRTEVGIELLQPSSARIERCEARAGAARLSAQGPSVTVSKVTWVLEELTSSGPSSFVAYPRMSYRASCLIYNGPTALPFSKWSLTVLSERVQGVRNSFSHTFDSRDFFVAATFAGAQVTATTPLLNKRQVIFVRVALPTRETLTLGHWTLPSRLLQLIVPRGFQLYEGPCLGFRPLTSSSLPPLPLTQCNTAVGSRTMEISIDGREAGFEAGHEYAFCVTIGNPVLWEDVESRMLGSVHQPRENQWSLRMLQDADKVPLVMLEDVPQAYSASTAALHPLDLPDVHDTSFRIYRRPISIQDIIAQEPYKGHNTRVLFKFRLSTGLRSTDLLQITAPSSFGFVAVRKLENNPSMLGETRPFPGREPEVFPHARWIMRISIAVGAEPFIQYGLQVNITNPSMWHLLDHEINFWMLETFYSYGKLLDRRTRRDAGIKEGYMMQGSIQGCVAEASNRVEGEDGWVSLSFQLSQPVVYHSWTQPRGPSRLRIRLPNGFRFASYPVAGNCSDLIDAEAFPDSPALPIAQFPHGYSPLADLSGFECILDNEIGELAREVDLIAVRQSDFGLLPQFFYAFRVHVISATYDKIWDTKWSLMSADLQGRIYETCSVDSLPILRQARASMLQEIGGIAIKSPLSTKRVEAAFQIGSDSPILASPEPNSLQIRAPSGFVFLRDCAPSVHSPAEADAWKLISCEGRGAEASIRLGEVKVGSPLQLSMHLRTPASSQLRQSLHFSLASVANMTGFQSAGLIGLSSRKMGPVVFQPEDNPLFQVATRVQKARVELLLSTDLRAGGFIEVAAPRHAMFVFNADMPCPSVFEDPVLLEVTDAGVSDGNGATTGATGSTCSSESSNMCAWPSLSSCRAERWGTVLRIQVGDELQLGIRYCFKVRIVGPTPALLPALPLSVVSQVTGVRGIRDLAPIIMDDFGQGWGVAPFVPQAAHLSLCYKSRIPSSEPVELVARLMPSSLAVSKVGLSALRGRLCVEAAALPSDGSVRCEILEPIGIGNTPACTLHSENIACNKVCVSLSGSMWSPFVRVVVSLFVKIIPNMVPRAYFELFDSTESLLQGTTVALRYPVLSQLGSISLTAPRTASTDVAFPVVLAFDWAVIGKAFLDALVQAEEEEPAFLDVMMPAGLRVSLGSCSPVACSRIIPDLATPRPGIRVLLHQAAPPSFWRRLRALQHQATASETGRCSHDVEGRRVKADQAWKCQRVSTTSIRRLGLESPPSEVRFLVAAAYPLTATAASNSWSLVLRSSAMRALAAEALPGFGVSDLMHMSVAASSHRAGDVFSRFIITFQVQTPLNPGDVLVLLPPSEDITCLPQVAEPTDLFGPMTASTQPPMQSPRSCIIEVRQPLKAQVFYSFNIAFTNPILTPEPNIWFAQAFAKGSNSGSASQVTRWESHSVAESLGFQVSGEFFSFNILPKSSVPDVFTPVALHFKLRTALPDPPTELPSPILRDPPVRFRFAVFSGGGIAPVVAFDPKRCMLDVFSTSVLFESVQGVDIISPADCLVTNGGAAVEFFLSSTLKSRYDYVIWSWMRNPLAAQAQNPTWTYTASTIAVGGRFVHRTSVRLAGLLGVQAKISAGSYVKGALSRAVVKVIEGKPILGERGSIEVTLPKGFEGSCEGDHFRARPALPVTARCYGFGSSQTQRSRIVVFWRTLFGPTRLTVPYEFTFALRNANASELSSGPDGAWHVRLFEGENRGFAMDGTVEAGLRPFDPCHAFPMSLRRDDERVVSIVFIATRDLPEGFEKMLRVELLSSSKAPAHLACPDTSIWQRRTDLVGHLLTEVQGLPRYTQCVQMPAERDPPSYLETGGQRRSAVLFLLPFPRFRAEPYGIEVLVERDLTAETAAIIGASEARTELVGLYLESSGVRQEGGSALLGEPAAAAEKASTEGGSNAGAGSVTG